MGMDAIVSYSYRLKKKMLFKMIGMDWDKEKNICLVSAEVAKPSACLGKIEAVAFFEDGA
jgi:hypothetical protein